LPYIGKIGWIGFESGGKGRKITLLRFQTAVYNFQNPICSQEVNMGSLIAVCGLDCAACEAYLATQADDEAAKETVAAKWRAEYNSPGITAKTVTCDGCLAASGRLCGHCLECAPRLCAVERGLANCGLCPEYGCEKISGLLKYIPAAKARLDEIHAGV
jgi:hypothetical protein